MKKLLFFLCLLACAVLAAYDVILFGDVHFDSKDVRDPAVERPDYQKKEMKRNMKAWKKDIPFMLDRVPEKVGKDTAFAVQLGDIVQGDCGSQAFHEKSLNTVLSLFRTRFPRTRFFTIPGNHDIRGQGARVACHAVMIPYLSGVLGEQLPASGPVQYAVMQEKDLYIFMDCNAPDFKFLEDTVKAHPDRRHLFVLTHFPVLFLANGKPLGTLFRKPELLDRLFRLLAENNAIVLCAHVHRTTLVRWKSEHGTVTQVSLFSMFSSKVQDAEIRDHDMKNPFPGFTESPDSPEKQKQQAVLDQYLPGYTEFKDIIPKAGFAILKPSGDGVVLDLYNTVESTPIHTLKLK